MSDCSHEDEARRALAQKIENAVFAQRLKGDDTITLTATFAQWQEVIAALRADPVRAAEEMRERAAYAADTHTGLLDHDTAVAIAAAIRSLPIQPAAEGGAE